MLTAARLGAWAKSGGWVNPYVTDGLIAMWDGEWNAGGGVHKSNATVWNDLCGVFDLSVLGEQTPIWNSNSLDFNTEIFNSTKNFSISGSLTCEFVISNIVRKSNHASFWGVGVPYGSASRIEMQLGFSATLQERGAYWSYPAVYGVYNNGVGGDPLFSWSPEGQARYWFKFDSSNGKFSGGAEAVGHKNGGFSRTIENGSAEGIVRIGSDSGNSKMRMYCLRIYNRSLYDLELTANRDVDFSRFWTNQ